MQSKATNVEQYMNELPEERRAALTRLRETILGSLPAGFSEVMGYGMVSYVVPHSLYPAGYHCDPKVPLPFLSFASQKNFVALYHMGLYADKNLLEWFVSEYAKHTKTRLDMGKSCIRFKKPDQLPFELIAGLVSKMTPEQWIAVYEQGLKK